MKVCGPRCVLRGEPPARERDLGDLEDRHEGAAGHSASD